MESVLVASPYLKDSHDFQQQPPSASSSNHFDGSHPSSPYEGFAFEPDFPQENHHFPHTPSYNGSYQNSPYSVISDLPYENPDAPDFSLFDNRSAAGGEEYDPSEYDIPNGPSLLTFDESFMPNVDVVDVSVSITPPFDQPSPTGYDHSSPASSAGEDGRHSRASSTSSYMHPNSPPLDFAHNFESLHFDSPAWGPSNLPVDRPSPPAQKPQSPPQLVIPESPAMTANEEPPTINAPEGDGMLNGPQLHIVPATPVSGGGGVAQSVPFLQQGQYLHLGLCCIVFWHYTSSSTLCSNKRDPPGRNDGKPEYRVQEARRWMSAFPIFHAAQLHVGRSKRAMLFRGGLCAAK